MPAIHLVEGPVGAGKSTFAARLCLMNAAPRFILDDWMATLFRPDRPDTDIIPWYLERKRRCIDQIWNIACDLIDTRTSVVLELGLIRRQDREDFYSRVDAAEFELKVYVLDTPEEVRRQRVRRRNIEKGSTFRMEVPDEMFEIANNLWEAPDSVECRERRISFISANQ
ncbi:AAA family ATPase [Methylococcus mesophilus]|uniref:AAA family ATPase n=1 Tax=Methylococcus mesophilus TaxID=2993564 RepID=UPI00224B9975|nr:AAA family ATPase [Methylococcus mesophilus]UZR27253.1 AAA family ATPase [Methylococcus mesophilus]